MSLYYHIKELRFRFIYLLLSILFTFLVCYYYSMEFTYIYVRPFLLFERKLIFTDLTEAFSALLTICMVTTISLLIPFFLYQVWSFLVPSFYRYERKKLDWFCSFLLFFFSWSCGAIYFYILPEIWNFLLHYQIQSTHLTIQLEARIDSYVKLSFNLYCILLFVLHIPFFYKLLFKAGVVTPFILSLYRKYFLLFFLIIAAFISPPEIMAQLIIGLLFSSIYEIGIWIGYLEIVYKQHTLSCSGI